MQLPVAAKEVAAKEVAAKEVAAKEVAMVIVRTARTEETARRGRGEGAAQITQRRTQERITF